MAVNPQNTTNTVTNSFNKGMLKDPSETFLGEGIWTHARNAVNNSVEGQLGLLGNEPANRFCTYVPYTLIGAIYLTGDEWILFSTDDVSSEIGKFDESKCEYVKLVNDRCLNFKTTNLISGASASSIDCTRSVYWDDGLNPTRTLNINDIPYKKKTKKTTTSNCNPPVFTDELDCEALRISPLISLPCISVRKAPTGGTMPNGSYQVVIAYSENGVKVTDYFISSSIQSVFSHTDVSGAIEVIIDSIEQERYTEFELVLISYVKENIVSRKIGNYSTQTKRILIDKLDPSLAVVQTERIPVRTPSYEKSDTLLELNDYLIRIGVYTKPDFNYQPQANSIKTKWVAVEYPADYYVKGGNITSYLRDEVYSFFIRWVYNTGEKSASYHIPGRAPVSGELGNAGGRDAIENLVDGNEIPATNWEVKDTSSITSLIQYPVNQGGTVVAEGDMAYWQSSESYPDDKPEIWGSLCGEKIRHHKMPDNSTSHIYNPITNKIVVLGVKFEDITHPLDINKNPIESIVGYEILRGSREGNKTVIAKGLLNNMAEYTIDPDISSRKGLYANYPFNDLNVDPFLSLKQVKGGCQGKDYTAMGTFRKDLFSFHSPDTQFRDPFLNPFELKIHGELSGTVTGKFVPAFRHPKHKLIRDFAVFVSGIVGVGTGMISLKGKKTTTTTREPVRFFNPGLTGTFTASGLSGTNGSITSLTGVPDLATGTIAGGGGIGPATVTSVTEEQSIFKNNSPMALAAKALTFTYFFGAGQAEALRIIKLMLPYEQFAYQYNAHGFYNNFTAPANGQRRRLVLDAQYINPYLQDFGTTERINNLFRSRYVAVKIDNDFNNPRIKDNSRVTIGMLQKWESADKSFTRQTSAHYASLKIKMASQYGQLDGISQIPISSCVYNTAAVAKQTFTSPVLFGGDVYINRYTEKNAFFFFNDWLLGQADGFEYDYLEHINIPYPRYWMNTRDYDPSKLIQPFVNTMYGSIIGGAIAGGLQGLFSNQEELQKKITAGTLSNIPTIIGSIIGGLASGAVSLQTFKSQVLPNDYFYLDRRKSTCTNQIGFGVSNAYMYLFANGVRDFFVESEINLAQRDWGEEIAQRHYDEYTYTDLQSLFRSDIIKAGNYYKYDYSLSANRMFSNLISWGNITPKDFDPLVSETCYAYLPKRAIYSLPASLDLKRDNWQIYLANNYYDFGSKVTSIKAINQSGSMILFEGAAPAFFAGVDQLQTQNGIKVTIGDGGLFGTPMQAASNAEGVYEYASCQSRYSVINTPAGLFWISQNQGKVFQWQQGLKEISRNGMKWWFAKYLPSQLLKQFPEFKLKDNTAIGIGTSLAYDNTNDILYVCKKDYKLKDEYVNLVTYTSENKFTLGNSSLIYLGDPQYFEDASLTVSYDVKTEAWISFHDWHPDFVLPSRSHFMTVKENAIWKHNDRCDKFCNFYTRDYPFEIEFVSNTGQEVTTLKSVEYQLECYKYANDCKDRNNILDFNFDRAVVYNAEQCSGDLRLVLKPKNDPLALVDYPIVKSGNIDILYSKEENKYRFNQFWDITRNRGEFTENYQTIWETSPNGYDRELNFTYLNYQKTPFQHKKIRHYLDKILLKRMKSDDVKMLFRLSNAKVTKSFR